MEEEAKKMDTIDTWIKKHDLTYTGATRHPFIISIRDGTVDLSSFKTWLGQDYIFVREFIPFVASVLIKASKDSDETSDMEVILGAMTSLNGEIEFFKRTASDWDVQLSTVRPQKTNQEYCRFLESLMSKEVEYSVAITALWAIESVYQKSFAHCLEQGNKTPTTLSETCSRWGNDDFGNYCYVLKTIANRSLEKASNDVLAKAETVFLSVLEHEVDFWNMSSGRN